MLYISIMRNRALQEGRAPRAPNACAWVAYTASKKRHGLLQAACTSMVKEGSQNGVGCHDSYHVYHVRYLLIRIAQMLLACVLLHVTQVNMQREVLFQRTRCLSDVLQHAAAQARCPGRCVNWPKRRSSGQVDTGRNYSILYNSQHFLVERAGFVQLSLIHI